MKLVTKLIILGVMVSASVAFAGKSTDPDAVARQTLIDRKSVV